jgi:hypothetical protein
MVFTDDGGMTLGNYWSSSGSYVRIMSNISNTPPTYWWQPTAGLEVNQSGTGNILNARAAGTSRLIVTNGGNVGIGTSLPSTALDIDGEVRATEASTNTCTTTNIGAIRYNSSTDGIEYCSANSGTPKWTPPGGAQFPRVQCSYQAVSDSTLGNQKSEAWCVDVSKGAIC